MQPGIWQIIIVIALALLLFGGRGKISSLMGDAAKGIRAFRDGLKGDEDQPQDGSTQAGSLPNSEREKEEANR